MKFIIYSPYINIDQYGTPSFNIEDVVMAASAETAMRIAKFKGHIAPIVQPVLTTH